MDKYLFIHSQTGQLLHHHDLTPSPDDPLALSMQLSALTQLSQQQLHYLQTQQLLTFAYAPSHPVFLVLYFPVSAVSIEDGIAAAQELMRVFLSLIGDWTGGKIRYKVFKQIDEAVQTTIETRLKSSVKDLFRELGRESTDFIYLTIPAETPVERPLKHAETSLVQLNTPLTTDVSALARGSTPIPFSTNGKKKYPVQPESGLLPGRSTDFARLYPNKKEPNEHILNTLAAIGKGCGALLEGGKDVWSYVSIRMEERWLLGCKEAGLSVFAVMSAEPRVNASVEMAVERVRLWAMSLKAATAPRK